MIDLKNYELVKCSYIRTYVSRRNPEAWKPYYHESKKYKTTVCRLLPNWKSSQYSFIEYYKEKEEVNKNEQQ